MKLIRCLAAAALLVVSPAAFGADFGDLFRRAVEAVEDSQKPGLPEDAREELLDAAIAVFRKMLVAEPRLVRVRLELARAFFLKGEDTLARRHFEQVLAGKPPAAVVLNVDRFLAQIRARKRWSVRVGLALAPDSNISTRSEEKTVVLDTPFGRLPFTYEGDKPRSGIGLAAWAGGEYQYPLGEDGSWPGASRWRLRGGADISRREYRSDEFDRMTVSGHLGPRWLADRVTEASVLASVRQSWLADEADWRDLGVRIEAHRRLSGRTTASVHASRHERRFRERPWLDGPVTDVSANAGWIATPTTRIDAGAGWGRNRTETESWRNSWHWFRFGATELLPWGFTVGGAVTLRWTGYEGDWAPWVLDGGERRDLTRSFRLSVHNRAFTVGGFSPQVWVVQEERMSNAQLHGYDRIFGELRFVRLF